MFYRYHKNPLIGDFLFAGQKFHFFEEGSQIASCGCSLNRLKFDKKWLAEEKCYTCMEFVNSQYKRFLYL